MAHDLIASKGDQGEQSGAALPQLVDYAALGRLAEGLLVHYSDRFDLFWPLLEQ